MKIEIYISNVSLEDGFNVNTNGFGVEDQIDQLLQIAMQEEFGNDFDVDATSGPFDSIELWNKDGDMIDPSTINAPIRIGNALKSIDWSQIDYGVEKEIEDQQAWYE